MHVPRTGEIDKFRSHLKDLLPPDMAPRAGRTRYNSAREQGATLRLFRALKEPHNLLGKVDSILAAMSDSTTVASMKANWENSPRDS